MVNLNEFEFIELIWSATDSWSRHLVLKFDDELIATIIFPSIWSRKAICTTTAGVWTIKTSGTFKPKLTVRRENSKDNLIEVDMNYVKPKSPIRFPSGNIYEFKKENIWKVGYSWFYKEEPIFDFHAMTTFDKRKVKVTFTKSDFHDDDLSLMLLIGSYLTFVIQQNGGM